MSDCGKRWAMVAVVSAILVVTGCSDSGSSGAASSANASSPELFTIPQEQMSHVQVLTVQPTTLTRILRLTGAVAYNSFPYDPGHHAGEWTRQSRRGGSRTKCQPGSAHVVRGEPRLLPTPHQLPQS